MYTRCKGIRSDAIVHAHGASRLGSVLRRNERGRPHEAVFLLTLLGCLVGFAGCDSPTEPTATLGDDTVSSVPARCLEWAQDWGLFWYDGRHVTGQWGWFVFDAQFKNTCNRASVSTPRTVRLAASLYDPHGQRVDAGRFFVGLLPGERLWVCAHSSTPTLEGRSCRLDPDHVRRTPGTYELRYEWRECDFSRNPSCEYPPYP